MDTANHCLAVRNNVGFVTSNKLADRHDYGNMLGGNRGLRETFRKGILESPEYGFNLYCCTTSDSKDPDICKQTGPVGVDRLPGVPEEKVRADRFTIDETLGLTERHAWNRGRLPRNGLQDVGPGGRVSVLMGQSGWARPQPMADVVNLPTWAFVVDDPPMCVKPCWSKVVPTYVLQKRGLVPAGGFPVKKAFSNGVPVQ